MLTQTLTDMLKENGFAPIPCTSRTKADAKYVKEQRAVVARSILQALDSIPYLTDYQVESAIWNTDRDAQRVLSSNANYNNIQKWKRARRYFPEMVGGRKTKFTHPSAPYVFSESAYLTDAPEVRLANPNWAIQEALDIPERLVDLVNLDITWCKQLNLFLYKHKDAFHEALRVDYKVINQKYGGYKDLRSGK